MPGRGFRTSYIFTSSVMPMVLGRTTYCLIGAVWVDDIPRSSAMFSINAVRPTLPRLNPTRASNRL